MQDIANKWAEVRRLVPERDQTLQAEMIRQQNNERLRRQFAQKANVVGQWIERHLDMVASVGVQKGSLEDHLSRLRGVENEVNAYRPNMADLERINEEVQEAMIFDNRHTPYTMETLRVGWEQLLTSVARNINEVENQVSFSEVTRRGILQD